MSYYKKKNSNFAEFQRQERVERVIARFIENPEGVTPFELARRIRIAERSHRGHGTTKNTRLSEPKEDPSPKRGNKRR